MEIQHGLFQPVFLQFRYSLLVAAVVAVLTADQAVVAARHAIQLTPQSLALLPSPRQLGPEELAVCGVALVLLVVTKQH